MKPLKPVRAPYEPRYPRSLTPEEVERLLRPGLFQRFSRETLLTGALFAGLALTAAADGDKPRQDKLTKAQLEEAQKKARDVVREILDGYKGKGWNEHTSLRLEETLPANPPVKYPAIPIMFGNSRVGIFDTAKAVEATRKLFEVYGLKLRPNQAVKGDGYEFEADGWDPDRKIGFELIRGEKDPKNLEKGELEPLSAAVKAGKLKVFAAHAGGFPNMDNDLYTPMEFYLASVIDYLNWVRGGVEIDRDKVLDRVPKKR